MRRNTYLPFLIVLSFSLSVAAQIPDQKHNNFTINIYEGLDEQFYSDSYFGLKNSLYSAFPVNSMIRHNRVDGLFLGYQEEKMNWNSNSFLGIDNIDLHGMAGYSMGLEELQYAIGVEKSIGNNRKWLMIGSQLHKTSATEDYWRSGLYENSLTSFTAGFDYHDYYKADGYGLYSILRPLRRVEVGVAYTRNTYSSLENNTDFSLISKYSTFRINPAIDADFDQIEQQSFTIGVTLKPFDGYSSFISSTIAGKAELAQSPSFDNDFNYNKWEVEVKSMARLDKSTAIHWRVMAGSITGEAPDFKSFALGGIGSMRALGFKSLTGNQMLLSNLQLQFGQSNSHFRGWPDLSSTHLTLFLDSGATNYIAGNIDQLNPLNDYQFSFDQLSHNAGIGLGLGMLRFEVATPVSGLEGQTSFWIRFNPTF